jgi:hypothetical protein
MTLASHWFRTPALAGHTDESSPYYVQCVQLYVTTQQLLPSYQQELHDSPLKLRLHEVSRETSQVDRLPAASYLPHVNVDVPEMRSK